MPSYRDRFSQVEKALKDYLANGASTGLAEASANLGPVPAAFRPAHFTARPRRAEDSDIFAKTFQFKSPVVDALALGIAPAECYDDLASLLRHNSSASSLDLGAHNSEEGSKE
ncbi:hypothetical protein PC123_g25018 [Phytophthora cactorum]|nr:hypothetical protein PC123_g25018 [Phytophthora cactorum]